MGCQKIDYLLEVHMLPHDLQEATSNKDDPLFNTSKIYLRLVESELLWKVWLIDKYDAVWVEVNSINAQKEFEFHALKLDDGSYKKIAYDEYDVHVEILIKQGRLA